MMSHPLISIITGFVLWSVIFLLFYGVQATGCYLAWDRTGVIGSLSAHRLVLASLLLLSSGFSLILFLRTKNRRAGRGSSQRTEDFARDVGNYVWLAALFAIPFCFVGVVWLTLCGN
jgi:hypothetical protein